MLNLKNALYTVTALLVFTEIGYSYNLKPRARENFEVINLKTDGEEKLCYTNKISQQRIVICV